MEGYGPSSYGDGMADVYDEWYATRGDIDGAVAALGALASAAGAGPVLELGIGSGRLALPLAASGVQVWGIDASTAMVARLRAKPGGAELPVAVGDMADLDLSSVPGGEDARFSLVFAADNTFFNLITADAQARCLSRVHAVLAPTGTHGDRGVRSRTRRARVVDRCPHRGPRPRRAHGHAARPRPRRPSPASTSSSANRACASILGRFATPRRTNSTRWRRLRGSRLVERWSDWRRTPFTADDNVHVSIYEVELTR